MVQVDLGIAQAHRHRFGIISLGHLAIYSDRCSERIYRKKADTTSALYNGLGFPEAATIAREERSGKAGWEHPRERSNDDEY